jgi:hypothetical protein
LLARNASGEGWDLYERRLQSRQSPSRPYPYPVWDGGPLQGKRLLAYGEQGLGDEILFASCLAEAAAEADQVFFACHPRLRALFARAFPQVTLIDDTQGWNADEDRLPVDFRAAIGSLPRRYRRDAASYPTHRGYLRADAARVETWRQRLQPLGPGRKLGLVWQAGRASTGRELRSIDLEELLPLLRLPGVSWVSLQHGLGAGALESFRAHTGAGLAQWNEALADMDEMAALMCALDGVVAVCSTAVHLCGALGRPVWVLTPYAPTWRYLLEGETLPWYPSARLFRQPRPDSWHEPVARLAGELRAAA